MSAKRRSFEAGHRPKFVAVADATPECRRAIHFAARRAARIGASLVLIAVVAPPDQFEWKGVEEAMLAEAEAEAKKMLDAAASHARSAAGIEPELVLRTGKKSSEIVKLIDEDEDISFLVLAASESKDGPGPLVSSLASKGPTAFPIPVVIVPGSLSDEEIDALAG